MPTVQVWYDERLFEQLPQTTNLGSWIACSVARVLSVPELRLTAPDVTVTLQTFGQFDYHPGVDCIVEVFAHCAAARRGREDEFNAAIRDDLEELLRLYDLTGTVRVYTFLPRVAYEEINEPHDRRT